MFFKLAAVLGGTAILFGAFGAHALKGLLSADQLSSYLTGVQYHLIHAVACLAIAFGSAHNVSDDGVLRQSFLLLFVGTILFSGSIYLLSSQGLTGTRFSFLGPVTPIGGLLMTAGWFNLMRAVP